MAKDTYIPRTAVPGHLLAKWGFIVSKNTLAKLAHSGGGPEYRVFGKKAYYTDAALEVWVAEKLSPPRRSTSDLVAR